VENRRYFAKKRDFQILRNISLTPHTPKCRDGAVPTEAGAGAPDINHDSKNDSLNRRGPAIVRASGPIGRKRSVATRSNGYRMIESFEASNFRCFKTLKLTDLKRVSIITGANASGKSALLEALLCGARGTAEALLLTNQLRGLQVGPQQPLAIPGLPITMTPQDFPALWDHLFYSAEHNGVRAVADQLAIGYSDSEKKKYSFSLSYGQKNNSKPNDPSPITIGSTPLVITRTITPPKSVAVQTRSLVTLGSQGQLVGTNQLNNLGPNIFVFSSVLGYAESDNVLWFSQLREAGKTDEIVSFIKEAFPFIKNLEVLALSGSPGIYASLESGGIRRLQLISSGINKIVTILLACASAKGGIILVDEIENGIFYEKYEMMWSILYKFSRLFEFQLFVSSHSSECLEKLVPVIGEKVEDFSLIRTERENGACVARHISGASMKAALKRGGDIRGIAEGVSRQKQEAAIGPTDRNH
jgi:hypothetical protein